MGELNAIRETLRRAATRRRLERALHGVWFGLFAGALLWLALLAAYKVIPFPPALAESAWILPLLGAGLGALVRGWRSVTLPAAARLIEARQNLDQRLSTALELAQAPPQTNSAWTQLVVADAAVASRGLHLSKLFPLGLSSFARWTPVLLVLVVGLGFVPEYRSAAHRQRHKESDAIRETGRRMAELVRHELKQREPQPESIREALRDTAALGERLASARLTKAEALQELVNTAKRLQDEGRRLDSQPLLQRLRQAARSPSTAAPPNPSATAALQKQLDKLQQSPGTDPDALEKLARQLQQARQAAAGMQGNPPDAAAQQALAQALIQLAQSAQQMGLDLTGLGLALDALQNLDIDRVLKDLGAASKDLDNLRDLAKSLAGMQKAMEQMDKDLAEQLARGQARAAAETLDRMVKELEGAELTPQQLESMMGEVTRALTPAGEYGRQVAESMKDAGAKLEAREKGEAARNLASAAAELRKLAQQAQDAQQLAEALAALQGAQLAIASGRMWQPGQCQGGACTGCGKHPNGRIGWSKGGKPGRGVGTWADETAGLSDPEISERWDNSGVNRPDMAGRGLTDRGAAKLSEHVLPTKLSGQFSPGPMPSINLKGVSIVGQSTVPFQQAVEAAQSEAQSALNQDQVPRAYRGAVKGYFDDLE